MKTEKKYCQISCGTYKVKCSNLKDLKKELDVIRVFLLNTAIRPFITTTFYTYTFDENNKLIKSNQKKYQYHFNKKLDHLELV